MVNETRTKNTKPISLHNNLELRKAKENIMVYTDGWHSERTFHCYWRIVVKSDGKKFFSDRGSETFYKGKEGLAVAQLGAINQALEWVASNYPLAEVTIVSSAKAEVSLIKDENAKSSKHIKRLLHRARMLLNSTNAQLIWLSRNKNMALKE